jgi:coproporphyrinogen III oxidase
MSTREEFTAYVLSLQQSICTSLEKQDGEGKFLCDSWQREEGGGGLTCIIQNGKVYEKGGVNTSVVHGEVSPAIAQQLNTTGSTFFACGLSLVMHPVNPFVPTVHANFRFFELYNKQQNVIDAWFGGGADLTPYYLFDEDATHFHNSWKNACDALDLSLYPTFKKNCDQYFVNHHRDSERRGIGGIFYDHLRANENQDMTFWLNFSRRCGDAFLSSYLPIVEKRKYTAYNDHHTYWQEIRRGRYVEFNLLHDRGTLFGLKSNGRTESILMSLPPRVRFAYAFEPEAASLEDHLLSILKNPKEWTT